MTHDEERSLEAKIEKTMNSALDDNFQTMIKFMKEQRLIDVEAEAKKLKLKAAADQDATDKRAKKRKETLQWLVPIFAVVFGGGGGGSAYYYAQRPAGPPEVKPVEVQQKVVDESKDVQEKVEENDRKIRKIGGAVIKLQDQQAETVQFLGDKLDAISPKAKAIKVDDYPQLKAAKKRREEKKSDDRVDELFEEAAK